MRENGGKSICFLFPLTEELLADKPYLLRENFKTRAKPHSPNSQLNLTITSGKPPLVYYTIPNPLQQKYLELILQILHIIIIIYSKSPCYTWP